MTWILSFIPFEWLLALGAAAVLTIGAYFKGKGASKLADAKKQVEAANDRLEMHREATDIEKRVAGMSDEEARAEAAKWARR